MHADKEINESIVICHKCEGEGVLWNSVFEGHTQGYILKSKKCPVCKGKRVLNKKVTIEYSTI